LAARGEFAVFRVHQKQLVDFRPGRRAAARRSGRRATRGRPSSRWLRRLGRHDQLVRYVKPEQPPVWLAERAFAALPEAITVRELRFTVAGPAAAPASSRWPPRVTAKWPNAPETARR
jgi:hypothetical protein